MPSHHTAIGANSQEHKERYDSLLTFPLEFLVSHSKTYSELMILMISKSYRERLVKSVECVIGASIVLRWAGALRFGYGCTVHVGVDVEAGDAEVDVIYVSFIMSVQYIGYLWTVRN